MAVKEIHYNGSTYPIYYEILNPSMKDHVIVLHGWGSNKEIMKGAFSKTLKHFKQIYIDMPGFGKSPNDSVLTTMDYKNIIARFMETTQLKNDIIMGHSFGGKVATLLQPNLLVLLSSAGIKPQKPLDVKLKIALFKLFKNLGFGKLRSLFASDDVKGMSQNMYETFKNVVDEDFSNIFQSYNTKALLFWGKSDTATPLSSGEKIHELITQSTFYPMEGNHFFFTQHAQTIGDIITEEFYA